MLLYPYVLFEWWLGAVATVGKDHFLGARATTTFFPLLLFGPFHFFGLFLIHTHARLPRAFTKNDAAVVTAAVSALLSRFSPFTMVFLHLFIVNKSGGLIHHRPLSPKAPRLGTNEWLRIGSTFHSLHAIAAEASPLRMQGNKNPCKQHNE
jgi:hypothetical protein